MMDVRFFDMSIPSFLKKKVETKVEVDKLVALRKLHTRNVNMLRRVGDFNKTNSSKRPVSWHLRVLVSKDLLEIANV